MLGQAQLDPRSRCAAAPRLTVAPLPSFACLQEQGFLYVHTPIVTASDCEGAGEMFQVGACDSARACSAQGKCC